MSLIASYPVLTHTVKFLETTTGRDKLLRVLQYWSRFFSFILLRKGYPKEAIQFWKHIQATVGLSRKLFRVGKPFNFIKLAATAYSNKTNDPILRTTSFLRSVAYSIYFTTDTIAWIQGAKLYHVPNAGAISRLGNQFWLFGMVCNIINSLRRHQIATAKQTALLAEAEKDTASLKKVTTEKKAANIQLVWDVLDTSIPIANLKYADLDDGVVGLAGLVTSLLGTKQQWASTY